MKRMSVSRKFLVRWMAQQHSQHVLLESTRAAIEKMAEEFAREALADPDFRTQMRTEVRAAMHELVELLKANPCYFASPAAADHDQQLQRFPRNVPATTLRSPRRGGRRNSHCRLVRKAVPVRFPA
jgi:hypothetical protein